MQGKNVKFLTRKYFLCYRRAEFWRHRPPFCFPYFFFYYSFQETLFYGS